MFLIKAIPAGFWSENLLCAHEQSNRYVHCTSHFFSFRSLFLLLLLLFLNKQLAFACLKRGSQGNLCCCMCTDYTRNVSNLFLYDFLSLNSLFLKLHLIVLLLPILSNLFSPFKYCVLLLTLVKVQISQKVAIFKSLWNPGKYLWVSLMKASLF